MEQNPFANLIRAKTQLDFEAQKRLANLLEPYIWLDPENNLIAFKDSADSLNTLQRVLIYILACKVKNLINPEITATASPSEIESGTGLPGGTVRPKLTELFKKKLVIKTDGNYEIAPNFLLKEIEQILKIK